MQRIPMAATRRCTEQGGHPSPASEARPQRPKGAASTFGAVAPPGVRSPFRDTVLTHAFGRAARCAWLAMLLALAAACAPAARNPAIVIAQGQTLKILTIDGQVLSSVKAPVAFQEFAVSPDASRAVLVGIAGPLKESVGGPLYLIDLRTGKCRLLTRNYYWLKPDKGWAEVYGDPDFSPDGDRIVFAVRNFEVAHPFYADNDAVNDSGPVAVMDLRTRKVTILRSSLHIGGAADGVGFSSFPAWSPDARQILFSVGSGGFITSPRGVGLQDLTGPMETLLPKPGGDSASPSELGWLGSHCVIYGVFDLTLPTAPLAPRFGVRVLHLATGSSRSLSSLLRLPIGATAGVEEMHVAGDSLLITTRAGSRVYNIHNGRLLYSAPAKSKVMLVPAAPDVTCG